MSLESGNESLGNNGIKTFFKRHVFINKLSGLNLICHVQSLDSLADVLNGLDDLGSGRSSGQHMDGIELLFEKKFASISSVDEGAGLRFHANLVFLGLFLLLGKKTVLLDGEGFLHGL